MTPPFSFASLSEGAADGLALMMNGHAAGPFCRRCSAAFGRTLPPQDRVPVRPDVPCSSCRDTGTDPPDATFVVVRRDSPIRGPLLVIFGRCRGGSAPSRSWSAGP